MTSEYEIEREADGAVWARDPDGSGWAVALVESSDAWGCTVICPWCVMRTGRARRHDHAAGEGARVPHCKEPMAPAYIVLDLRGSSLHDQPGSQPDLAPAGSRSAPDLQHHITEEHHNV